MKLSEHTGADDGWIRRVPIYLAGEPEPAVVGVVPIVPSRKAQVYRDAKEDARAMGVEKWDESDPNCALALQVRIVEAGAVDLSSDAENPEPWATAQEIRESRVLGEMNIAILAEQQQEHERSRTIRINPLTPDGFWQTVAAVREGPQDDDPLGHLPRPMLETFARTMVAQFDDLTKQTLLALQLSESAGTASGETEKTDSPESDGDTQASD